MKLLGNLKYSLEKTLWKQIDFFGVMIWINQQNWCLLYKYIGMRNFQINIKMKKLLVTNRISNLPWYLIHNEK